MRRYIVTFVAAACAPLGAFAHQSGSATNSMQSNEERTQHLEQHQQGLACEATPQVGSSPENSVGAEADAGAGPSLEPAPEAQAPEGAGPGVTQAQP